MARGFLDDAARKAFADAVTAVEAGSAVEVVIAVRTRARRWLHAHLIVGFLGAWAALAFMMYSDVAFSRASFLIDPILAGILVGAASTLVPAVARWLTPRSLRRRAVIEAARATFYERGIHHTVGRTGVLVYVAVTEQMAELVADDAVLRAMDPARWQQAIRLVDAGVAAGGHTTATRLVLIAPLCSEALPRAKNDLNELPDALDDGEPSPAPEASP